MFKNIFRFKDWGSNKEKANNAFCNSEKKKKIQLFHILGTQTIFVADYTFKVPGSAGRAGDDPSIGSSGRESDLFIGGFLFLFSTALN